MGASSASGHKGFKELLSLCGRAVCEYGMIEDRDRILVGMSGGKDSLMMMHALEELRRRAPVEFTLVPVCFDPQFQGFNLEQLRDYCSGQGWELNVVSMDMPSLLREKNFQRHPCVLCSRLRRGHLHGEAQRRACNKIALGHHLDDLCVSLLMSLFRGQGITTMGPKVPADGGRLTLIRPLCLAAESLVVEAAIPFDLPRCGDCEYKEYLRGGDRAYFKGMLEDLEQRIPGVRQQMLASMRNVQAPFLMDKKFIL